MDRVFRKIGPKSDIILLYRAPTAAPLFDKARRAAPNAKIIFHAVDLHFLRMQRQAELTGNQDLAKAATQTRVAELDLMQRADAAIVVSASEEELVHQLVPGANVHHIPILRETPHIPWNRQYENRIGLRKICRLYRRALAPDPIRRDLLFIGGFLHSPNIDAVEWFVGEIWPKLLRHGFQDRFIIAGSHMPNSITQLNSERIIAKGYVRDLAPLFAASRLTVAPLRYGGGVKGKIVSSLSYGVPVIATSIAAEGMGLTHGSDVLVADTPDQISNLIMDAYYDNNVWQRISANGYDAFMDRFSQPSGTKKIIDLFENVRRK
ncbi:glycosyltransferase [Hyphomicrobium sp.]|jgi:glycosyltransferase involved in cell wall biosynthesis|uniref:glycosyltransferase n=1 Tax=Hyphomicrobium sp. TaxID=82 RepID=UPI003561F58E